MIQYSFINYQPSLNIDSGGYIYFGSHCFSVDELGILLKHLQSIHFPDHSL